MKTKIVYCLVSDNTDYYYEQLMISLYSLKKHNPDALVEVICDQDTFETFRDNRRGIFDYDIHVISVETPKDWSKWQRSRYLKTNLRKHTKGNYLFIDTDTVICSSLDFIDDFHCEIAAVYDSHLDKPLPKFSQSKYQSQKWIWTEAKKIGVDIEGFWHFNSGVMFVSDTPKVYDLYTKWNEYYQKQLKYGLKIDQLPLLLSNRDLNDIISPLEWNMNCQVPFEGIRNKVTEAKIIHYFPSKRTTLLSSSWILDPIKESGRINISIQRIVADPDKFFDKLSCVAMGNTADLLQTPSLFEAYTSCPKVFRLFANTLNAYLLIKKKLFQIVHLTILKK